MLSTANSIDNTANYDTFYHTPFTHNNCCHCHCNCCCRCNFYKICINCGCNSFTIKPYCNCGCHNPIVYPKVTWDTSVKTTFAI